MKFEEALKKLEEIVQNLESEEFSLDDSLKKFEEGIKLSRICRKKLEEIEKKVQMLIKTKEGELKTEPFSSPEDEH
jgi:exodeoxyribonuclease VII small subunit